MNKYHNIKTIVGGITFDSKAEAARYQELLLLQKAKVISELELQPKFLLQEGYKDAGGKKVQPIYYIADFRYMEKGKIVIEDVKGFVNKTYAIKKKMFEYRHAGLKITEIK